MLNWKKYDFEASTGSLKKQITPHYALCFADCLGAFILGGHILPKIGHFMGKPRFLVSRSSPTFENM